MPHPRRSDALRNREAILNAAREVLAQPRTPISLERVARVARVGQATVYRHFPDRRALVLAVVSDQIAAFARLAASRADEAAAFRSLLDTVLQAQLAMRPLVHTLRGLPPDQQRRHIDQVVALLAAPLSRAPAAGHVRADLGPADLTLVLTMAEAVIDTTADNPNHLVLAQRAIALLLDSLLPRTAPP
ncbi:TetR/AcrR family transcriptional regulator [Luedemannella flava]|uniref:TetR/AcrR family transcriptional regulator n=1 Tax=Luedemannella flava TaxID=349316 RepID=A0ABP4YKT8_9ACTN